MTISEFFDVVIGAFSIVILLSILRSFQKLSAWRIFLIVGGAITFVRWTALLALTYLEWTDQLTLGALPVVFFVWPEGMLFSNNRPLTGGVVMLHACTLAAGSFLFVGVVTGLGVLDSKLCEARREKSDQNADG